MISAPSHACIWRKLPSDVEACQRFDGYADLEAKMAGQGPTSLDRIRSHRGKNPISIPMPYRLALL